MALTPSPPSAFKRPRLKKTGSQWVKGGPNPGHGKYKGVKNKRNRVPGLRVLEATRKERLEQIAAGKAADRAAKDLTPLGFMEEVLRHPSQWPSNARMWAAKEAAPYIHRKQPIAIETGPAPEDAAALLRENLAAMNKLTGKE